MSKDEMGDRSELELSEILKEVRRIEVQSSRLVTDVMAGGYSSVFRGAGIEFEEVREYEEGDDPRTVDWNVTARVGRPFVKKFADERQLTVLFLVDLSASMSGGYGIWSPRQAAARVCACLGFSAVKNSDQVGLVAFSKDIDRYVPPKKGMGHALKIVRDVLSLKGESSGGNLQSALDFITRVRRRRAVVFLLSDFLDEGYQDSLAFCARHHDLIAVRLISPEMMDPPPGFLRIKDPESGEERLIDWSNGATLESYRKRCRDWNESFTSRLRQCRVDLIDVPIPREPKKDAIARPILDFFRMRELRGARR